MPAPAQAARWRGVGKADLLTIQISRHMPKLAENT